MKISFAPLEPDGVAFLYQETEVDFTGAPFDQWLCVTARNDHGAVVGVLTAEPRTIHDWHFSCAVADQRCMSRRLLRTIFTVLFDRLGAARLTALVSPYNHRAIKQMGRLGFVYEGFGRLMVNGNRDALMFGMLRDDCRWLPGYAGGTILTPERSVDYGLSA